MRKLIYISAALIGVFVAFNFLPNQRLCKLRRDHLTISTVSYGAFDESIPQTGIVQLDTMTKTLFVKVNIDQLYIDKISTGLIATCSFNTNDYLLAISHIYPEVEEGRFSVEMIFKGNEPLQIFNGQSLRLRIHLSNTSNEILLPVGGFYKDTGGKWVFVIDEGKRATRRNIKLGRKNPEFFEVLQGLNPGDRVITSSYEQFIDRDTLNNADLQLLASMQMIDD
jgi:hypothetical protein